MLTIVPVAWSHTEDDEYSSSPQKLSAKTSALKAKACLPELLILCTTASAACWSRTGRSAVLANFRQVAGDKVGDRDLVAQPGALQLQQVADHLEAVLERQQIGKMLDLPIAGLQRARTVGGSRGPELEARAVRQLERPRPRLGERSRRPASRAGAVLARRNSDPDRAHQLQSVITR